MLFNKDAAKHAFQIAREIKEHRDLYCLAPDRIPTSIDDLKYVVENMFDLKIEMNDVDFSGDFVRGMVERYADGRARVSVRRNQSNDEKRFVAAKELCQLAIGTDKDRTTDGPRILETMVFAGSIENGTHSDVDNVDRAVQSEYLAEFAAFEVLYPYEFRMADKKLLEEGKATTKTLANHYDVPAYVVSVALSERYEKFRSACTT